MICPWCKTKVPMLFPAGCRQICRDCKDMLREPKAEPAPTLTTAAPVLRSKNVRTFRKGPARSYRNPPRKALRARQQARTFKTFEREARLRPREGPVITLHGLACRLGVSVRMIKCALKLRDCPPVTTIRDEDGKVVALRSNADFASFLITFLALTY